MSVVEGKCLCHLSQKVFEDSGRFFQSELLTKVFHVERKISSQLQLLKLAMLAHIQLSIISVTTGRRLSLHDQFK